MSGQEEVQASPSSRLGPSRVAAGVRVVVEENHDLPLVRVSLTLLTGAASDPVGREGLAYFTSELACRGAAGRSREDIDEAFERLGADLSISADYDSVSWDVEVLSKNLGPAFALLCDILLRPDLPSEEASRLRREMHAAIDELRDDDGSVARRFYARQLYGTHAYGNPTAGTPDSIERLHEGEARRWIERVVTAGNLIVGAAGDVDSSEFHRLVERRFGVLRAGQPERLLLEQARPPKGLRVLLVDKPERTQSQLVLGQPAVRRADPAFLPLAIGVSAFGGTFSSPLMQEVRVKRGLSYGASARVSQGYGARAVSMSMAPATAQTVETLELVLGLWRSFALDGPKEDDIRFAQDHMASGMASHLATPEDRVDLRLGVEICALPANFLERLVPSVRAVTPAEVLGAIRRWLLPDDLAITILCTASELLPALRRAKLTPPSRIEVVRFDSY